MSGLPDGLGKRVASPYASDLSYASNDSDLRSRNPGNSDTSSPSEDGCMGASTLSPASTCAVSGIVSKFKSERSPLESDFFSPADGESPSRKLPSASQFRKSFA